MKILGRGEELLSGGIVFFVNEIEKFSMWILGARENGLSTSVD